MEEGTHVNSFLEFREGTLLHLKALFDFRDQVVKGLEDEYHTNVKKLEETLFGGLNEQTSAENKTPQQTKKRSKRLTAVDEGEIEQNVSNQSTSGSDTSKSARPTRAAKMNLNLKEKPLAGKFRRPSNPDTNLTVIKKEKPDDNSTKSQKHKEKTLTNPSSTIQIEPMEFDIDSSRCDASVLIVKKQNFVVEIESDDELHKMPPPTAPVPKKLVVKKKSSQEALEVDLPKPIKVEKLSMSTAASSKNDEETNTDISVQSHNSKGQKKKTKKPKPIKVKPIIVKEERVSLSTNDSETPEVLRRTTQKNLNQTSTRQSQKSNRGGSFESVYEDAMPLSEHQRSPNVNDNEQVIKPKNINIEDSENSPKITLHSTMPLDNVTNIKTPIVDTKSNNGNKRNSDKEADSTFVSAKDIPTTLAHNVAVVMGDATFVKNITATNPNQDTFVIGDKEPNFDATITIKQANPSETFVRASIMTEDNSEEESGGNEDLPNPKYKPKPKSKMNKNQIFNPFVQSPMKKKVEAFEKAAANVFEQNPPQRQTRTKTRAKKQQQNNENIEHENKIIGAVKESSKTITPTIGRQLGRALTPTQSCSSITPTIVRKMPNSASKTIGLTKVLSAVGKTSGIVPSRSRDNSNEDLKRGFLKFQQLAAERKKKREEKQQQASNIREQKEKERTERLKRMMEEREEKLRIADQKRQVEEIQKNLKLLEEKNEQKRKLEKQRYLEKAAAAAAKKEREVLENLKIQKAKEQMQLKYLKNQKLLQTKAKDVPQFNFEMLHTDDETDEEEGISKKRPPLPEWSKKEVRKVALDKQGYLPTTIIDKFFSVQPLTADLRELFPTIDSKYCKRNSSMFWTTPPRYSELPKY